MVTVDVCWLNRHPPHIASRGYHDQGLLEAVFDHSLWRPPQAPRYRHREGPDACEGVQGGAVVVVPARHHLDDVDWICHRIRHLDRVVLVLTGDEASEFDHTRIDHPDVRLWVQTPDPDRHRDVRMPFGDGWPPDCHRTLSRLWQPTTARTRDWWWSGQVRDHLRRQRLTAVLDGMAGGEWHATGRFLGGMPWADYLSRLADTKVAPAPAGFYTVDTFRLFEALEAGCVPVVSSASHFRSPYDYWPFLCGGDPPFPVVDGWDQLPAVVEQVLSRWPADQHACWSWWQQRRRLLASTMTVDARWAAGLTDVPSDPADTVTVVIPTSPIPSHPDTAVIEATVESVRAQEGLVDCQIIVAADGVRDEQQHRAGDYAEYVTRLLGLCAHRWHNVVPLVADRHLHQSGLLHLTLPHVDTPHMLYVEHDTPIVGDVPWAALCALLETRQAHLVRLYHEASVHPDHRHLMVGDGPVDMGGVPVWPTMQWSQRPHLTTTDFYRHIASRYISASARTMIEDVMHGVLAVAWDEDGRSGWEAWRTVLYAPQGNLKRSDHVDARGTDPKYGMHIVYDGDTPFGAPQPRVPS